MQAADPKRTPGGSRRAAVRRSSPVPSAHPGARIPKPAITVVVDASAVLALLFGEPGAELVADAITEGAAISAVNLSEVATLLLRHGHDPQTLLAPVREQVTVEPFTSEDALAAAALYPRTSTHGLSLADRACLALARRLNAIAVTADRSWADLELDITIQLIRPRSKRGP
jgi:ribonuclease VapC